MKDEQHRPWIGVDLDGTLAKSGEANFDIMKMGSPIPAMVERVKRWLRQGKRVKIVTARVGPIQDHPEDKEAVRSAIEDWCEEHVGKRLEVTAEKDFAMMELWDDRAVSVVPNEGVSRGGVDERGAEFLGALPNGAHLYAQQSEAGGIHYFTNEIPGGCSVFDTTLASDAALTMAMADHCMRMFKQTTQMNVLRSCRALGAAIEDRHDTEWLVHIKADGDRDEYYAVHSCYDLKTVRSAFEEVGNIETLVAPEPKKN